MFARLAWAAGRTERTMSSVASKQVSETTPFVSDSPTQWLLDSEPTFPCQPTTEGSTHAVTPRTHPCPTSTSDRSSPQRNGHCDAPSRCHEAGIPHTLVCTPSASVDGRPRLLRALRRSIHSEDRREDQLSTDHVPSDARMCTVGRWFAITTSRTAFIRPPELCCMR